MLQVTPTFRDLKIILEDTPYHQKINKLINKKINAKIVRCFSDSEQSSSNNVCVIGITEFSSESNYKKGHFNMV